MFYHQIGGDYRERILSVLYWCKYTKIAFFQYFSMGMCVLNGHFPWRKWTDKNVWSKTKHMQHSVHNSEIKRRLVVDSQLICSISGTRLSNSELQNQRSTSNLGGCLFPHLHISLEGGRSGHLRPATTPWSNVSHFFWYCLLLQKRTALLQDMAVAAEEATASLRALMLLSTMLQVA